MGVRLALAVPLAAALMGGVAIALIEAVVIGSACASLVWLVFLFMFIRRRAAA